MNTESDEIRWVALPEVTRLHLHPAFGTAWPSLSSELLDDLSDVATA